jgi:rhodanese-related sulfurtransferase
MDDAVQHFESKLTHETDASDLNEMIEAGERVIVIDARSAATYREEHIPAAINVPHREMSEVTTASFDRDALYVTYCDGIGCNASTKGALNMSKLGFRVKELIGGIAWWKRDGYPVSSVER